MHYGTVAATTFNLDDYKRENARNVLCLNHDVSVFIHIEHGA